MNITIINITVTLSILISTSLSFGATTEGNRILNQAILLNDTSAVEQTLQLRVDINAPAFNGIYAVHAAATPGVKDKILEIVLAKGANPNVHDYRGRTPLHIVSKTGSATKVKMLFNHGADLDLRDYNGYTPLMIAVLRFDPNPPLVKMLLDSGADKNIINLGRFTALDFATGMRDYFKKHSSENAEPYKDLDKIIAMLK